MYGHYAHAVNSDISGQPTTSSSAVFSTAGNGSLAANSSLLDAERLFSTSITGRKESNGNLPKPIRWNTGTKNKLGCSDASANKSTTTKKLFSTSPIKDDLNNSFIEDPERKLVETPLHGVSGTSHISRVAGGGRQSDSGSFTEDLQKTAATGHNSRLEDSSLIRAFLPLSMNHDASDLSTSIQSRSRDRNTMDSGSFTADTNMDLYRMYPTQLHTTNIHQLTVNSQIKSQPQQPHTDVKPKYRPVRRPISHVKPEARKTLDQENKENKNNDIQGDLILGKLMNLGIDSIDKEAPHQQDMTHPTHKNSQPSGFNPVTHQPEYKHSNLRQQSSSRLKSAPSLPVRPAGLTEQEQHNEVKDVLENLNMIHRPSFAENKDFTDHGGSSIKKNPTLELKTPQTQKQLPAYIQNILNKGLTKPGINSSSSTKRDNIRSRYNSANTDTATRHQDSTFPYGGQHTAGNSQTKPSLPGSCVSLASGTSGEKVTDDLQLMRRDVSSSLKASRYDSFHEPTYPANNPHTRPTLPEILEQSTENNHSKPDNKSTFEKSNTNNGIEHFVSNISTSQYKDPDNNHHHHIMNKSKSVSNVESERYKHEQPQSKAATAKVETMFSKPMLETPSTQRSYSNFDQPKSSRATHSSGERQQEYKTSVEQRENPCPSVEQQQQQQGEFKPPQAQPQQQICDDRTPRPVESGSMIRPPNELGGVPNPSSCMPPPPPSLAPPPTSNSNILVIHNKRYRILKVLGKGGSSKVYEAVDEHKNNVVAIKQVDLSCTDEAQAAGYVNEINMLAKLQGEDRIVKLFDYENDQKREILYVVMEKGDTDLASLLKNYALHKEITPAMVKHYWTEMLHAVNVIHKRGIIHSDLKPANFLLVAGRLKLIDFGIASSVQSDMTSVMKDTQMGTFNFMSPEAIQDLSGGGQRTDETGARKPLIKISYKSDVWSLGCILYNLAYGKMPFGDIKIPVMKLQAILNPDHQIPFPTENVDPQLLSVIKACLTRDVKMRPSIEELLQHTYVTGIEAKPGATGPCPSALKSDMLARLETNLQGVLSPGTFQKMKRALQDPNLAKKLDI